MKTNKSAVVGEVGNGRVEYALRHAAERALYSVGYEAGLRRRSPDVHPMNEDCWLRWGRWTEARHSTRPLRVLLSDSRWRRFVLDGIRAGRGGCFCPSIAAYEAKMV